MIFWIVAALLTVSVVALVLHPLLRPQAAQPRATYDAAVYRDQLAEVERDRARNLISYAQVEAAKIEIGRRLLAVADAQEAVEQGTSPSRIVAVVLVVLIPLAALALYLPLGHPGLPNLPFAERQHTQAEPPPEVLAALDGLVQHLQKQPDDLRGWTLLGETYKAMRRYPESIEAWRRTLDLSNHNPAFLAALGEALTLDNQGLVPEEAQKLFAEAIQSDPANPLALYHLAAARAQAGDLQGALDRWLALAAQSPSDAPWLPILNERIQETAQRLGIDPAAINPVTR